MTPEPPVSRLPDDAEQAAETPAHAEQAAETYRRQLRAYILERALRIAGDYCSPDGITALTLHGEITHSHETSGQPAGVDLSWRQGWRLDIFYREGREDNLVYLEWPLLTDEHYQLLHDVARALDAGASAQDIEWQTDDEFTYHFRHNVIKAHLASMPATQPAAAPQPAPATAGTPVPTTLTADGQTPRYAHVGDAGADLCAAEDGALEPGERQRVRTGVAVALPEGTVGLIHPRSGLAAKHGVTVLNAPATVDRNYRGELEVLLINHSDTRFDYTAGMRIAQLVVQPYLTADFQPVDTLPDNHDRGDAGFGSSGT